MHKSYDADNVNDMKAFTFHTIVKGDASIIIIFALHSHQEQMCQL